MNKTWKVKGMLCLSLFKIKYGKHFSDSKEYTLVSLCVNEIYSTAWGDKQQGHKTNIYMHANKPRFMPNKQMTEYSLTRHTETKIVYDWLY